jgi:hypothetical protein
MAFRRSDVDIPEDVTFPKTLNELGFKLNTGEQVGQEGKPEVFLAQVVSKDNPTEFFKFEKYENNATNQKRYGAMHAAVRKEVYRGLSAIGVADLYIHLDDQTGIQTIEKSKPGSPSIRVLSSPVSEHFKKEDLYLVVGDSKQDLGILSRKAIMTEGGLYNGSVLGLVSSVRGAAITADSDIEKAVVANVPESDLPGVVILNPGELLWSPQTQECMSAVTWQDRRYPHGFSDQYKITEKHNKILGHESPEAHVRRCLDAFLKPLARPTCKVRINVVAVGDASEHVIAYLNSFYSDEETKHHLADLQIEIAMIQPTHNADIVTTPALKVVLAKHGRSWESHSKAKGTLLADVVPDLRSLTLPTRKRTKLSGTHVLEFTLEEWENNHVSPKWDPLIPKRKEERAALSAADEALAADVADVYKRLARSSLNGSDEWKTAGVDENHAYKPSTCQRFSAGIEDTTDMILPAVMEDVLAFFETQKEKRAEGYN